MITSANPKDVIDQPFSNNLFKSTLVGSASVHGLGVVGVEGGRPSRVSGKVGLSTDTFARARRAQGV